VWLSSGSSAASGVQKALFFVVIQALCGVPLANSAMALADSAEGAKSEQPINELSAADGTPLASAPGEQELPEIVINANTPSATLRRKSEEFDEARDKDLLPKFGASSYKIDREAVEALPEGKNTPLDKVLLQAPGVSYDSAVSNPDFHVRNEYANVQYRINGIQLPDGVSGLGPVLETGLVGNLVLLDGALPAQYGLRTAGVVDITAKSEFTPGASLDLYAGSRGTVSPSVELGGSEGRTQYFLTARHQQSEEGLENAMPTLDAIHDRAAQEKFFGYGSTVLGDSNRLSYIAGASVGRFQIPDVAGLAPLGDFGPSALASTHLNENETDRFYFGIVALQTKQASVDTQLSVFTRYASVDFVPDVYDDLVFNDVASNVTRKSLLNGMQFDAACRPNPAHALRAGFGFSAEQTQVDNRSTVLLLGSNGNPLPDPTLLDDYASKLGWNLGAYVQDEWTLVPGLTLNMGVRFDQLEQFVSANQFSPRVAMVYTPHAGTTIHAGAARYFTPPMQAQATPTNLALFRNTTQQPALGLDNPVLPERSTYFDLGADQALLPGLGIGADVYEKRATDQLDDGQFGQAVVLTQFNYARGYSRGMEFKLNYQQEGLRAYANLAAEKTKAEEVVTNQYLFEDPLELAYLAKNYIYTDDAQTISASAGTSYRGEDTLTSLDGIFGSGLRTGFANRQHVPGYVQWNLAIARDLEPWWNAKPPALRLSVVNLFDRSYLLRSGTGIGEFAPQYGPRRGFFIGITQRI
jgi:hypothetical protein